MKNRTFSIILICLTLLNLSLFVTGCDKAKHDEIKIGVIGPFTGEGSTYGAAMKRGVELALEEENSNGGVFGKQLSAIYEDDKLSAKEGINSINKLINTDNVQAIIGSAASKVTLAIAPMAENAKVVLISSISTADTLKYAGEYIFRDVPPNLNQGITAARFTFVDLLKKNAVVLYKNDDYGISLSNAFTTEYIELGGKVLLIENYSPNSKNFRDVLLKIKNKNPEVVFFPGNYEESGIILRQAKEMNIKSVFVGGDGSYSPELIKIAGNAAEKTYYTLMSLPADTNKQFLEFKKRYFAKYSETPDVYAVYSYDAAKVIIEAIKKSGEYNGTKIKDALFDISYDGVSGNIKFDKFGEVKKDFSIYTVNNSKFVLFKN